MTTHVYNILHSIFSSVDLYINNQQFYNSNGLSAYRFYFSENFKEALSDKVTLWK